MNCSKCNNIIPDGSANCPYCGAPQTNPVFYGGQQTNTPSSNPLTGLPILIFLVIFFLLSLVMMLLMIPKHPSVGAVKTYCWLDIIRFASMILIPFGIQKTGLKVTSFILVGIGIIFVMLMDFRFLGILH